MTLTYQHIAVKQNRRAAVELEQQCMDLLSKQAAPFFVIVMLAAAATVLWYITADYRINAAEKQRENEIISAKLAACANGHAVKLGDAWLTCKVKRYEVKK